MFPYLSRLRPTAMSIAAASLAPSSSLSVRSQRLSIYHNPAVVNRSFLAIGTLSSGFPNASVRCFAAAADKVRVQNPIVEMDGEFLFAHVFYPHDLVKWLFQYSLIVSFLFFIFVIIGDEMTRVIWTMIKDKVWALKLFSSVFNFVHFVFLDVWLYWFGVITVDISAFGIGCKVLRFGDIESWCYWW